jgi:hypothetical protein
LISWSPRSKMSPTCITCQMPQEVSKAMCDTDITVRRPPTCGFGGCGCCSAQ